MAILTDIQTDFITQINDGFAIIKPHAIYLAKNFLIIDIVMWGIYVSLGRGNVTISAIKKLFYISAYIYLIGHYQEITFVIIDSFSKLGTLAGGSNISENLIYDPSKILNLGFKATTLSLGEILNNIRSAAVPALFLISLVLIIAILFCYFMISINIMFTVIIFHAYSVCCLILIPFSLVPQLVYLAENAIGGIFRFAIKLMVMTFMLSLSYEYLKDLDISRDSGFIELFKALLRTIALTYLIYKAPQIAEDTLSGSPNFPGLGGGGGGISGGVAIASSAAFKGAKTIKTISNIKK